MKIEIAELKSENLELKSTVYTFKSEETKDKAKIHSPWKVHVRTYRKNTHNW